MKSTNGFFILENIIVFTLGSLLMLSGLRTYHEGLLTLQKKLLLEEATMVAESSLHDISAETKLNIFQKEYSEEDLVIKEVKICHNDKAIFSLAKTK